MEVAAEGFLGRYEGFEEEGVDLRLDGAEGGCVALGAGQGTGDNGDAGAEDEVDGDEAGYFVDYVRLYRCQFWL